MKINQKLESTLNKLIPEKGFELYAIDSKREGKDWVIRVFVDNAQRSISLDECASLSHIIDEILDKDESLSDLSYRLEVSSPGLDRLLRNDADFEWAKGKTLKVKFLNEDNKKETLEGKLKSFDSENIELLIEKNQTRLIKKSSVETARRVMKFDELIPKGS